MVQHVPRAPGAAALRSRRAQRQRRLLTNRAVADALISAAGLVGRPLWDADGEEIGRLVDVVVRWDGASYPPVTGLIVGVGFRRSFVSAEQVDQIDHQGVRLLTATLDLRDFRRREGEVLLLRDVIDHQLVDVDGVRVVRAADLYLARVSDTYRLVGVDVGLVTLLRRLGPARWRTRPTPERVVDWAAVQPFGQPGRPLRLRRPNQALRALRPAELADLLEELGRSQRQELLAQLEPGAAADALEEMEPEDLEQLLREAGTEQAARLIAEMEPDEAVDALRDLPDDERAELLAAMPSPTADELNALLSYPERQAGGLMTSRMVLAGLPDTVAEVRDRLRQYADHREEVDAILVTDADGVLVDTVPLFDLTLAGDGQRMAELVGEPRPVTVSPQTPLDEVVARFVDARAHSLVVVDAQNRPLGRVLADDLVDALVANPRRLRFPRIVE